MPTITLKNVPEELYQRLKARALRNRRSLNNEAIVCLEGAVKTPSRDPKEFLADLRAFREMVGDVRITNEQIDEAKRSGRP